VVLDVEDVHALRVRGTARLDCLLAADLVGRQGQSTVDVRVTGHHRDQVQIGVVCYRAGEQLGHPLRPQILVFEIDESPCAAYCLGIATGDAALTVRREVVFEVRIGVGTQNLHGVRPARRRIRGLIGQWVRLEVRATELVHQPRDG
jgi:hypothetical protein